jgi:hypothetical protein
LEIELISALCIVDPVRRAGDWNTSFYLWNEVIDFARKRDTFDDDAVEEFQTRADILNAALMSLVGRDAITNYTHIVSSGHQECLQPPHPAWRSWRKEG